MKFSHVAVTRLCVLNPCALGWDSCTFDVFSVTLSRPLREVYHLWTLAGGDMEGELKKRGLIKTKPPIMTLPMYVSCWFCSYKCFRSRQI